MSLILAQINYCFDIYRLKLCFMRLFSIFFFKGFVFVYFHVEIGLCIFINAPVINKSLNGITLSSLN